MPVTLRSLPWVPSAPNLSWSLVFLQPAVHQWAGRIGAGWEKPWFAASDNVCGANTHCCSVNKSYLTLCDPMDCSTPGSPVLHHLLEFAQIHSTESEMSSHHPILCQPPSPPGFSLSQHQGLFQWVWLSTLGGQNIGASVLPMNVQGWLPSGLTGLISLLPKALSRVFYSTTVRKHQSKPQSFYEWPHPPQKGYREPTTISAQKWGPKCIRVVVVNMILALSAGCFYLYYLILPSPQPV